MLDRERPKLSTAQKALAINLERLQPLRGDSTAFFAFADTVAARNYQGTDECHGWMGVKFQTHPPATPIAR